MGLIDNRRMGAARVETTSEQSPSSAGVDEPERQSRKAPLTARQLEVLQEIERFSREHNYPPSGRELAEACGLGSPSGAHRMVCTLERKGYLARSPGLSRGLSVVPSEFDASSLGPREFELLATLCIEPHRRSRDASLAMAASMSDTAIQTALIAEAASRDERLVWLDHEETLRLDAAAVRHRLREFPGPVELLEIPVAALYHRWADFVLTSFVTNCVQAGIARELDRLPEFRPVCFWRDVEICTKATQQQGAWLDDILGSEDINIQPLRVRTLELARRIMVGADRLERAAKLSKGLIADPCRDALKTAQLVEVCGTDPSHVTREESSKPAGWPYSDDILFA